LPDLADSRLAFSKLWGVPTDPQFLQKIYVETLKVYPHQIAGMLVLVAIGMGSSLIFRRGLKLELNWFLRLLLVPVCLYAVWIFSPSGVARYIYFDF
jgi:alginate O-acetyltransferase complex protein AlgI